MLLHKKCGKIYMDFCEVFNSGVYIWYMIYDLHPSSLTKNLHVLKLRQTIPNLQNCDYTIERKGVPNGAYVLSIIMVNCLVCFVVCTIHTYIYMHIYIYIYSCVDGIYSIYISETNCSNCGVRPIWCLLDCYWASHDVIRIRNAVCDQTGTP